MLAKHNPSFITALAVIAGVTLVPQIAAAQASKQPVAPPAAQEEYGAASYGTYSQDAFDAMLDVHAARRAIFNGETKLAGVMVEQARTDIETASASGVYYYPTANGFIQKSKEFEVEHTTNRWIVADARVAITEDFTADPEKLGHIEGANKHFEAGKHDEGLVELQLAGIDVYYTRSMLPLSRTMSHITKADELLKEGKYYQANLALKAAEEGLRLDTDLIMADAVAEDDE